MKVTKVTKKNCKRVAQIAFKELQNRLSCYGGYATIYITPTRKRNAYITSAANISVNDVFQESKWKESMFYGAEVFVKNDKKSGKEIALPCVSISIKIEDDEQQG